MASKAGEAEVQNVRLLDWLSPKQTAVCKANAAPSRDILNVKKKDSGHFVNKQESDGGDVEEKEEEVLFAFVVSRFTMIVLIFFL